MSEHPQVLQVLFNRRFWPIFWAQFLGAFNDNLIKMSTVLLITYAGRMVLGVEPDRISTVVTALLIIPSLLFSAMAGQLADRYSKTRMVRPIKLFEVVLMGVAAVGLIYHQFELLLVVVLCLGTQSTFFGPIKYSILPELLTDQELVAGNALVESGTNLAILFGTLLGGYLISRPGGAVWVSAALLAVALGGYVCTLLLVPTPAESPELQVDWNPLASTWQILREVYETRTIFRAILAIAWFWVYGLALVTLFVPYVFDVVHGNEDVQTVLFGLFSIGVGVGSILCEKLSFGRLELGLIPVGSIGMSLFAADLCFAWVPDAAHGAFLNVHQFWMHPGGPRVVFDLFLVAMSTGFYVVPLYTFIQARAKAAVRSRVVGANNIMGAIWMSVWAVVQIQLLRHMSVLGILLLVAVLNFLVAVYIYTVIPEFFIRFCAYFVVRLMYRVRVQGVERIPAEGPAILVCNHVSYIDWLVILGSIPRPVRFVMHQSFMNIPLVKVLMKQAHTIPIASGKENSHLLERAYEKVAAELREGELVCIFPEGALTHDGDIAPFKRGVEKMVADTPVPVVPMALQGLWGSFFSHKDDMVLRRPFRRMWSRVSLVVGEPVPPQAVQAESLQSMVGELRGSAV